MHISKVIIMLTLGYLVTLIESTPLMLSVAAIGLFLIAYLCHLLYGRDNND